VIQIFKCILTLLLKLNILMLILNLLFASVSLLLESNKTKSSTGKLLHVWFTHVAHCHIDMRVTKTLIHFTMQLSSTFYLALCVQHPLVGDFGVSESQLLCCLPLDFAVVVAFFFRSFSFFFLSCSFLLLVSPAFRNVHCTRPALQIFAARRQNFRNCASRSKNRFPGCTPLKPSSNSALIHV